MDFITLLQLLESTVRAAVPRLLACLAGLYSERSGIVDIGLEGKMLAGAFAAAAAATVASSVTWIAGPAEWLEQTQMFEYLGWSTAWYPAFCGVVAGVLAATLFSLVHGFASITVRGNQIVSGVAINFIALGLAAVLAQAWFGTSGRTPQLRGSERIGPIDLPGAAAFGDVPVVGPIYERLLSGQPLITWFAFLMVPVTWWVLFRTRFGLRLRAVGENPAAVDTAGISVAWLRYRAVIICGALCGVAGTYLSTVASAGYVHNMTAGRGFIALAALIFAKWRPVASMWACLLFGFLYAVVVRYQSVSLPVIGKPPAALMQTLPYILVLVLLAGFVGRAIPPRAIGVPYRKER